MENIEVGFPTTFLGSDDPQLFPAGLRVLFVVIANRKNARSDLLKKLANNCPLLQDLRLHYPSYFTKNRKPSTLAVSSSSFFLFLSHPASTLRSPGQPAFPHSRSSQSGRNVTSFTKQLKHLHTLDLSSLLPNRTPPWSPDQNEVLEDLYDGEDSTLHRRWRDHVQEFQLYMSSVTMELKKDLPELRRFWWITHTERMDGKKIPSTSRYQRTELKLQDGAFQIAQVRDREAVW